MQNNLEKLQNEIKETIKNDNKTFASKEQLKEYLKSLDWSYFEQKFNLGLESILASNWDDLYED